MKHLKGSAIALRREGKSYGQILKALNLSSKGTLSAWFKNLDLSYQSKLLLKRNTVLAHQRGLTMFNKERTQKIRLENESMNAYGKSLVRKPSAYDLMLLGAALYWGEGTKSNRSGSQSLAFTNSDPLMVAVFMRFLREVLKVKEEKIRGGIHLYPTIKQEDARLFWSKITGLPREKFYIVSQVSSASKRLRGQNMLPHGTLVVKVSDRRLFSQVMGIIEGIGKQCG